MAQTIKSWSFSALQMYESCPYQAKLKRIDKVEELPRPAPPDGKEHANDRGSRVHEAAEAFVKGQGPLIHELRHFEPELNNLAVRYQAQQVSLEHTWCFDNDWRPVPADDFKRIWLRVIADVTTFLSLTLGVTIDYKTGKKFGNEVKHGQQAMLYQLATFLKFPKLEEVITEWWYLDKNEITSMRFPRNKGMQYFRNFNKRALRMTSDTEFKPKPSRNACMFCPYGPKHFSNKWVNKNGACKFGVN